jgi:hypothetical protein
MDIRRWRWPAAIVAGLVVAAFLASPYLTAHRIGAAVRDGDEAALAGMFIDKAVDTFVTPSGVARLVSERQIVVQPGRDPVAPAEKREPFAGARMSYETFDRFVITVEGGAGGKTGTFVLRRRGLGWKLTEIIVPIV